MKGTPRVKFCWECSRKLWGNYYTEIIIDRLPRILHKSCARSLVRDIRMGNRGENISGDVLAEAWAGKI